MVSGFVDDKPFVRTDILNSDFQVKFHLLPVVISLVMDKYLAGLDPTQVHASISGGAAGGWAMTNLAPRALAENFAPGFYVKHILKDMGIALDSAAELGLELPGLACARRLYDRVAEKGWEECGTQALYRLYASL